MMRRLPRFLSEFEPKTEGPLVFSTNVDLHPADTVVFRDGTTATVNSVEHRDGSTVAVLGENPHRGPRPHSGGRPPVEPEKVAPIDASAVEGTD